MTAPEYLLGRPAFFKVLERTMDRASGAHVLALLVVRIRQLRGINTYFCYKTSDLLLMAVGKRICEILRDGDFLAWIADADYAVILPGLASPAQAELVANRIGQLFEAPFVIGEREVKLDAAMGIAYHPKHAQSVERLVRCAGVAAWKAFNSPVDYYVIYSDKHEEANCNASTIDVETALTQAINQQEFEVYVQPKVHLMDQRVSGVETLLRWHRTNGRMISPGVFIPILERSKAIVPVTAWTLNTALRQCGEYLERIPGFSVAVNLSTVVLNHPDILEMIVQATNIWCSSPEQLTLEVTESALMHDPAAGARTIEELREMGVKLSIDDFGTGYSSLSQISSLRVSELKIDQSFVIGATEALQKAAIVQTIIDLAHNFGMTVVAEGIEDAKTLEYLRSAGCDYGQGYYIAKPMPISQLSEWLDQTPFTSRGLDLRVRSDLGVRSHIDA
jgi:EAL domain-containing protein (putative c-di-GMP-specific phosphodiesterase class I)/GGDEF domain-containing protein